MDLEEAREISQMGWPENQKAQRQHDAVDWLVAEVERLEGELRATAEHWKETDERCGELQSSLTLSREEGRRDGETSFICFMIDHYEGSEVTEEMLQRAYSSHLKAIRFVAKGETQG